MSDLRSKDELRDGGVTLLGNKNTQYKTDYAPEVLETFENKHPDNDYVVSFDAYEFTSLCVSGDTLIDIATNETDNPEGVAIKDLVGTSGYVFGVDPDTLTPLCRKYKAVKKTGENVPVVKVIMDCIRNNGNGSVYHETSSLTCTPDHPILVKAGFKKCEWIKAKELKPGMRLIADQRNHKVVAVIDGGLSDVYNMEVEEIENYFANEVVVHNCPITSQPDFAKVIISYIPNKLMVESKSLKLYLFSFRNHGDFHEDCMNIIMKDLVKLMNPKYIEVKGVFAPRGGISIYPAVNWANPDFGYQEYAKQRQLDFLRDASNRTVKYDD